MASAQSPATTTLNSTPAPTLRTPALFVVRRGNNSGWGISPVLRRPVRNPSLLETTLEPFLSLILGSGYSLSRLFAVPLLEVVSPIPSCFDQFYSFLVGDQFFFVKLRFVSLLIVSVVFFRRNI